MRTGHKALNKIQHHQNTITHNPLDLLGFEGAQLVVDYVCIYRAPVISGSFS